MNLYQKPKTRLGKNKITDIAYCHDRNYPYRAAVSQFGILICDARTSQVHHLLQNPKSKILSVACSPGGSIIAAGNADHTVQLWHLQFGEFSIGEILKGHVGAVTSVAFSPDANTLASGSEDGTVRLWNVSDGSHKSTLKHTGVTTVVFSPSGHMLVSGGDEGTICFWESETRFGQNRYITTFDLKDNHKDIPFSHDKSETTATSLVFGADGTTLASGYSDGTIRLWDISTRKNKNLKGHADSILSLDFSSDGKTLASGSTDKTIRIWDTKTGQYLTTLKEHTDVVFSVMFQNDILVSESTDGSVRFWNTETGENYRTLGGYIDIESIAFSPNGQVLASIGTIGRENEETAIYFWDVNTSDVRISTTESISPIKSVRFSPDGKTLLTIGPKIEVDDYDDYRHSTESSKESICLWDVSTGSLKTTITEEIENLKSVRFSPDGKTLLIIETRKKGRHYSSRENDTENIYLWDIGTGEQKLAITDKIKTSYTSTQFSFTRFSPDSRTLVTIKTQVDKTHSRRSTANIYLWDVSTGEQKATITDEIETSYISTQFSFTRFSPDSRTLVTIKTQVDKTHSRRSTANIYLWDVSTGEQKATITEKIENLKSVHFSPNGKTLLTTGTKIEADDYGRSTQSSKESICLWDVSTGSLKATITEKIENLKSVHFSPDSRTLVGLTNSEICFMGIETEKFEKTTLPKGTSNIESITFSSDSRLLLSISTNEVNNTTYSDTKKSKTSTFCFWNVETGEPIPTHLKEMTDNIQSITLNSDKTKFAAVHSNNLIRLWDVDTGKHQSTFQGAQEDISSVAFSLDNRTLACRSSSGMILLWDIEL